MIVESGRIVEPHPAAVLDQVETVPEAEEDTAPTPAPVPDPATQAPDSVEQRKPALASDEDEDAVRSPGDAKAAEGALPGALQPVIGVPTEDAGDAAPQEAGGDLFTEEAPMDDAAIEEVVAPEAPMEETPDGPAPTPVVPAPGDDAPGPPMDDDAPAPAADDIFGADAPMDDDAPAPAADDIFGADAPMDDDAPAPAADDIFGGAGDGADIFDSPADPQESSDASDLFNATDADDLDDIFGVLPSVEVNVPVSTTVHPLDVTEKRVWVDNTGGFSVTGRLIEINQEAQVVRLEKDNGRTCTVPMRRLSQADAQYVDGIAVQLPSHTMAMLSGR